MDLTADVLTRVLAVCCGEPDGPEESVLMVRRDQPTFAPTLFAAWRNEGSPLNPALRYELDVQTARIRRYRELAADIAARVPGLTPLKGLEVADLYPADSTRYMNDLDYTAHEPRLWRLVQELVGDGWELNTGTFWVFDGRLQVLVCLRMPHEDPYCLPYGVEITSYVTMGDLAGVAPVMELPPRWRDPVVKNLLMLLFERFEQPYRARDLVDAALMLHALRGHTALWHEIDRLGLWPEFTELAGLLERAELGPVPAHPRPRALSLAGSRARRGARRLTGLRRPADAAVRHLQQRLVFDHLSRPERLLWSAAERRLSTVRALRAGLLCFGLPVPGVRPEVAAATVRQRDGLTFVDTPVARFLLTAGDDVDQDAVDALAADADPAPDAGVDEALAADAAPDAGLVAAPAAPPDAAPDVARGAAPDAAPNVASVAPSATDATFVAGTGTR